MPNKYHFSTIPEMFDQLTRINSESDERYVIKHKVKGQYVGITYKELRDETERFAYGLHHLGVKKGDKVAILSENRPEWVFSDFAILALGAIDVPLYPSLTADSIQFILNNSESVGIIVSTKLQLTKVLKIRQNLKYLKFIIAYNEDDKPAGADHLYYFTEIQKMGESIREQNPSFFSNSLGVSHENDLCTIIYTSGTTGEPKGVMLTHKNLISNINDALNFFPITEEDIFLSFLPLCHIFERMTGYYTAFGCGAQIYYAQSIETVATDLIDAKPTLMTAVPRLFERIYSKVMKNVDSQSEKKQKIFHWAISVGIKYNEAKKIGTVPLSLTAKHKMADVLVFKKIREKTGGRLKFFVSGGAALPRELGEFFAAVGITILEGYGLTEASPVIAANPYGDHKFGTVGKVFPSVQVKIAHDGEILAKGPNVMQGYYKNKKETDDVIKDGWLHTGDIGVFDGDGYLMITDRKKHLFKTSTGKYVAPTPIENLFLASKYIDQFVLIGDRRMFLSALIVPDFEALREYADARGIDYKDNDDLVEKQEVYELVEKEMVKIQKSLANYERVRKFALLEKPFTIESGEMTPSLKVKRKVIEERYKDLIEIMYTGKS